MKRTWIAVIAASLVAGCVPASKDGGEIGETETGGETDTSPLPSSSSTVTSGESASATSMTAATESASATAPPTESATATSTTTDPSASATEATAESGTTGSTTEQACLDVGWDVAFNTWSAAVEEAGDQYYYVVQTFQYGGAGFEPLCGFDTAIRVEQGVVVERNFRKVFGPDDGSCEEEFEEAGDQVGENDNPIAADPLLLEDIYAQCCENHLTVPPEDYDITFEVDKNGFMTSCYAVDRNCGEGCTLEEPGEVSIVDQGVG